MSRDAIKGLIFFIVLVLSAAVAAAGQDEAAAAPVAGGSVVLRLTAGEQAYLISVQPSGTRIPRIAFSLDEEQTSDSRIESVTLKVPGSAAHASFALRLDAEPLSPDVALLLEGDEMIARREMLLALADCSASRPDSEECSLQNIILASMMFEEDSVFGPESMQNENGTIEDPFEPINRAMFAFNDKLYFWAIKPLAQVYSAIVPEWVRVRMRNVFQNLLFPIRFVNSLLQLNPQGAARELGRFVVNTTAGGAGAFDILEDNPDAQPSDEDFGQTLGRAGAPEGIYIVWPFFGPSNIRDTFGIVGDSLLNPLSYLTPMRNSLGAKSYKKVNDTSLTIGDYEDLKDSAVDSYVAVRDAYTQYRRSKVREVYPPKTVQ